jgi:hypothetical protein
MDTVLIASIAILILAPVAYAAFLAVRVARSNGRVRLFEVLQGENLPRPDFESEASVRAGAYAVRRCVNCSELARCDQLIAARDWKALNEICPNRDYLDSLDTAAR